MKSRTLILLVAVMLFASVQLALANTLYVNGVSVSASDTNNNCTSSLTPCKTIAHAISVAAVGSTIEVAAATYMENLIIGISVKILGTGASTTIIDGGGVNRVVYISNNAAQVTLSGVTIRHGRYGTGAGIFNSGTLYVISSTISGNLVSIVCPVHGSCNAAGGGIYNAAILTMSKSTITGNIVRASCPLNPCFANADGGGIYNHGVMSISNSTLSGNIASHLGFGFGRGGAISNRGTANISSSTLAGNSANSGGGINNYVGYSLVLQNSLVANSSAGGNCLGTMTSNGFNLSSDGSCNFNNTGDMNNTNPMLASSLQNNGGPTLTIALQPGSPAIDRGNPSGCTNSNGVLLKTDQRGFPRPDSSETGCDIGAFETQNVN